MVLVFEVKTFLKTNHQSCVLYLNEKNILNEVKAKLHSLLRTQATDEQKFSYFRNNPISRKAHAFSL